MSEQPKDPRIEILDEIFGEQVIQPAVEAPTEEVLVIQIMSSVRPQFIRVTTELETYRKFGPAILAHVALGIFKLTGVAYQPDHPDSPQSDVPRD